MIGTHKRAGDTRADSNIQIMDIEGDEETSRSAEFREVGESFAIRNSAILEVLQRAGHQFRCSIEADAQNENSTSREGAG